MAKSQSFKCGNEQSNGNYEMCNDFKQSLKLIEKHKLVKVKINVDEAQKLTWKEIKCL